MTLEDLRSIMDEATFVAFLRHFGGRRVYVPKTMHRNHPVAVVIGLDAALALSGMIQGEYVDLPSLARYDIKARRRRILELRKQGKSFDMIAWECGCTRRSVIRVCADGRDEIEADRVEPRVRQLELF